MRACAGVAWAGLTGAGLAWAAVACVAVASAAVGCGGVTEETESRSGTAVIGTGTAARAVTGDGSAGDGTAPPEPLVDAAAFAPWSGRVPAGVPVRDYEWAPNADRQRRRIDFRTEVLIDGTGDDPAYLFGVHPPRVVRDDDGRLWALDVGNDRVQVYDATGELERSFGRRGEGPGEFEGVSWRGSPLGFVGDRLFLFHKSRRVGLWSQRGEYLEAWELPFSAWSSTTVGLPNGNLLVRLNESKMRGHIQTVVAEFRFAAHAVEEKRRILEIPTWARPSVTLSENGGVHVLSFDERVQQAQVARIDADGTPRWVTRLPWPQEFYPGANVVVDGRGRVYVLPMVPQDPGPEWRPADVLAPTGEHLLAGVLRNVPLDWSWQVADGDELWGVDRHPETEEWRIVRRRILWP